MKPTTMNGRFFYTMHSPFRWSSGPTVIHFNEEMNPISSLDEAKSLAEKHDTGYIGTDTTECTYGVEYKLEAK